MILVELPPLVDVFLITIPPEYLKVFLVFSKVRILSFLIPIQMGKPLGPAPRELPILSIYHAISHCTPSVFFFVGTYLQIDFNL